MTATIEQSPPRTAVVGGGVAGLTAAHRLARLGHDVTVFEAAPTLGGQVRTVAIADRPVDVGAESIPWGAPPVSELVDELGLADDLVRAAPSRTLVWTKRRLQPLPAGVGPAGPTRLGPVLRSRTLSPLGLLRAAAEPLVRYPGATDDVDVGGFLAGRFGHEVTERLVDPLLGGLHAADVSRLSLRATVPPLAALADQRRSVLLAQRARRAQAAPPSFVSFRSGLRALVDALATAAPIRARTSTAVSAVVTTPSGYELHLSGGETVAVDAVVVALPPAAAAVVLRRLAPAASTTLSALTAATVATVVLSYPVVAATTTPALSATGMLVPSSSGRLLKSATFLGTKWPHLRHPDRFLVRLSAGRAREAVVADLGDDELVSRLHRELTDATGLDAAPLGAFVHRWPGAVAQLEVGHLARLAAIRAALAGHRGVALVGAGYEGLGITRCVQSGELGAATVHASMRPAGAP